MCFLACDIGLLFETGRTGLLRFIYGSIFLHLRFIYSSGFLHLRFIYGWSFKSFTVHLRFRHSPFTVHLRFMFFPFTVHLRFEFFPFTVRLRFKFLPFTVHLRLSVFIIFGTFTVVVCSVLVSSLVVRVLFWSTYMCVFTVISAISGILVGVVLSTQ